jgi:hypothetical protein
VLAGSGHYRPRFLVVDKDTHYEDKNKTNNANEGETIFHRFYKPSEYELTPNSTIPASQAFSCLWADAPLN